jgi:hypothetical protein
VPGGPVRPRPRGPGGASRSDCLINGASGPITLPSLRPATAQSSSHEHSHSLATVGTHSSAKDLTRENVKQTAPEHTSDRSALRQPTPFGSLPAAL